MEGRPIRNGQDLSEEVPRSLGGSWSTAEEKWPRQLAKPVRRARVRKLTGWRGWQGRENGQRDFRQVPRPDPDLAGFVSISGGSLGMVLNRKAIQSGNHLRSL